jgi:hypothetical protein
LHRRPALE